MLFLMFLNSASSWCPSFGGRESASAYPALRLDLEDPRDPDLLISAAGLAAISAPG